MKKALLVAVAVLTVAGNAAAASPEAGTKCTWTAREIWPVAAFLTAGLWVGPETAKTEFAAAMPALEAARQHEKEARAELDAKELSRHTAQLVCQDATTTATVVVR